MYIIAEEEIKMIEYIFEYNLDYIKNLMMMNVISLQEFKGVGAKVADCIMLFSMEKTFSISSRCMG